MSIRDISISLSAFLMATGLFLTEARANSTPEKSEGSHEAAPAEKSEGESGKTEEKSSLSPWMPIENKIIELEGKIKSKRENITSLIQHKNSLPPNSPELKGLIKEIVKQHKEFREMTEELEKKLTILKYRYPERNSKRKQVYQRVEVKSVEDMEEVLGVDGKLNRNMKRMRSHFKPEEKQAAAPESAKQQEAVAPVNKEPSIEEAGSILIKK